MIHLEWDLPFCSVVNTNAKNLVSFSATVSIYFWWSACTVESDKLLAFDAPEKLVYYDLNILFINLNYFFPFKFSSYKSLLCKVLGTSFMCLIVPLFSFGVFWIALIQSL